MSGVQSGDLLVRPPAAEAEFEALADILAASFNAPRDRVLHNFEICGRDNLRVVLRGDVCVGGLKLVRMGQWFGGRSVPMAGIAAVGIAPAERGRGAGGLLMKSTVAELSAEGTALSTLYPATVPLYRSAGYELAGSQWTTRFALKGLPSRPGDDGPPLRAGDLSDFPAMERAYAADCAGHDGVLDRGHYIWSRVRAPGGEAASHFVVPSATEGELDGYVSFQQKAKAGTYLYELACTDLVVRTPAAARRIVALLGAHQSMSSGASVHLPANHPLLTALPEWRGRTELELHWMVRLTHVDAALEARGYPAGVTATLDLDVTDEVVPGQSGRRRLHVVDGRGTVEAGGDGALRTDVRGLAALYTGFQTAEHLALQERMAGTAETLAAASAVFRGGAPWMMSMF